MKKVLGMGLLALVMLTAGGCGGYGYRHYGPSYPPRPRDQMMERHRGRRVWIPGHYEYYGHRRVWVNGYWR